jgi:hypothetical protein
MGTDKDRIANIRLPNRYNYKYLGVQQSALTYFFVVL